MNCNVCGAEIPAGAATCPVCGAPAPAAPQSAPVDGFGPSIPDEEIPF